MGERTVTLEGESLDLAEQLAEKRGMDLPSFLQNLIRIAASYEGDRPDPLEPFRRLPPTTMTEDEIDEVIDRARDEIWREDHPDGPR